MDRPEVEPAAGRLRPYVPRVVLAQLAAGEGALTQTVDGTVVFVDVSGFTKLSERLARRGREGAEHLADAIGGCFSSLLALAYANGGSLLKFGGDALLLLFDGPGHVERGVRSAAGMRRALRDVGRIDAGGAKVTLRMSVGVHTGEFHLFLVGASHREFLIAGPAASRVVEMEGAADAGEILLSPETCERLPGSCVGQAKGPGRLLVRPPAGASLPPAEPDWAVDDDAIAMCLSTGLRSHVFAGRQPPEHRTVTVAFIHFHGTDDLIARHGAGAAAAALQDLLTTIQAAADEYEVCFMASDVDADGGKVLLAAGAPRVLGDDEERMLLALRRIVEADLPLPVHVGVNRGPVFAGDVGPHYRRTYTTMGDATNLAARLMSRAPAGQIYATAGVLDRSATRFELREIEPFLVKGKARPIQAWSVGPVAGADARPAVAERVDFVGRRAELTGIEERLVAARDGAGGLIELVGEPGIGKTRLLEEARTGAADLRVVEATCSAYRASRPYAVMRELLQQVLAIRPGSDDYVLDRLRSRVAAQDSALLRWLPLLALVFDIQVPATPEVEQLAPEFRQQALHAAVLDLLEPELGVPTLLVVEDAHHIDVSSADLLRAVTARLRQSHWLVAVARRDREGGFAGGEVDAALVVEPAPLSPAETAELAEALTRSAPISPGVLRIAVERSGGNPQFLRDLLRAAADGVEELPDSIESATTARIDRLAPTDRQLIRRLSVLGLDFDVAHVGHVVPEDEPVDASTWRRLMPFLTVDERGRVRFRRAVIREAAYAGLPFRTRRSLHALAGRRLEEDLGTTADEAADVLALHFSAAEDYGRAYHYARTAGDRAVGQFAYGDAVRLYGRALEAARHVDRSPAELAEVREAVAEARLRIGEPLAAVEELRRARRLVAGEPLREAELLHRQALVAIDASGVSTAVRCTLKGLRTLEGMNSADARRHEARLVATLGRIRVRQGRTEDAIRACRRAIELAESTGEDAALARACYVLDWALTESGRAKELRHARRALELYRRLGDRYQEASVLNMMGTFAYRDGRWEDAVSFWEQGREADEASGSLMGVAFGIGNVGELRSDQGRLDEAEPLIRRSRQLFQGARYEWGVAYTTALLGRLAVRRETPDAAMPLLDEAVSTFRALRTEQDAAWAEALTAEAHMAAGRPVEALELTERLLKARDLGRLRPLLHRVHGLALAQLGSPGAGVAALQSALDAARDQEETFEVALTLDALSAASSASNGADAAHRAERDAILERLGIVALPPCPTVFRDAPAPQITSAPA